MNSCPNRNMPVYGRSGVMKTPCHMEQPQGRMSQEHAPCNHCSCHSHASQQPSCSQEPLPPMSQSQLFCYINQVSFMVYDLLLYLDTHPHDQRALKQCREHIDMRNQALAEYARLYGPLNIDTANEAASESWQWVTTPWPWEGRMK